MAAILGDVMYFKPQMPRAAEPVCAGKRENFFPANSDEMERGEKGVGLWGCGGSTSSHPSIPTYIHEERHGLGCGCWQLLSSAVKGRGHVELRLKRVRIISWDIGSWGNA